MKSSASPTSPPMCWNPSGTCNCNHLESEASAMATPIVMPKQGNTVESVIIVDWKKQVGDAVAVDDVLCEVETDKATMEVPSTVEGTLLATLYAAGDEVAVMETIAWIGAAGEAVPG